MEQPPHQHVHRERYKENRIVVKDVSVKHLVSLIKLKKGFFRWVCSLFLLIQSANCYASYQNVTTDTGLM